jgi:serine/threonine protein kinase HipA of HipAB toxin-antitoxin module
MKPKPHRLIPGPDYPTEKEALSQNAKSVLRHVEQEIANDPDPRVGRYQYPMSKIVVDLTASDLAVSYYVLKNGDVVLLDVKEPKRE